MITIKDVERTLKKDYDVYEWFNDLYIDYVFAYNEIPEIWDELRNYSTSLWEKLKGLVFETAEDFNDKCVEEVYHV